MTVRVVYRKGLFIPQDQCDLTDGTEGFVLVSPPGGNGVTVNDPAERKRVLAGVVADMQRNPIPQASKKLTRDQMHERD